MTFAEFEELPFHTKELLKNQFNHYFATMKDNGETPLCFREWLTPLAPSSIRQESDTRISTALYNKLVFLGIIDPSGVRLGNVGNSNYADHIIQPWAIWLDYPEKTPWDDDIIKRVLRTKPEADMTMEESLIMDYKKIIHNCNERIRQLQCKKYEEAQTCS